MKIFCEDLPNFPIPEANFHQISNSNFQIIIANTENFSTQQFDDFYQTLSKQEQAKANKFYFEKDRKMSVLAHGLKRKILAKKTGIATEDLIFDKNEFGKPRLRYSSFPKTGISGEFSFNISHSSNWVALIFAKNENSEIGIDIEFNRQFSDYQLIMEKFFNVEEQKKIQSPHDFFKFWTRKEAVLKILGMGLINDLQSIQTAESENICYPNSPKMTPFFKRQIFLKSVAFLDGWISFGSTRSFEIMKIYQLI